jgi:hypothetical protein
MLYIPIVILVIFLIIRFRKTKIKFKTFLKKGFSARRGKYGVYCYCGKQGSGKTYSAVEFLLNNKDMEIFSNVATIKGVDYEYFTGFDKLLELREKQNCIIFYDEIFTALTKSSKMTTEVLDFLSQMRKRKIIFITTAQEWLEINITLRRYCRYQIECSILSIAKLSVLIKRMYDAEQLKWSNDDNEYVAPLIETTISKCNLSVANSYDTFEQIKTK